MAVRLGEDLVQTSSLFSFAKKVQQVTRFICPTSVASTLSPNSHPKLPPTLIMSKLSAFLTTGAAPAVAPRSSPVRKAPPLVPSQSGSSPARKAPPVVPSQSKPARKAPPVATQSKPGSGPVSKPSTATGGSVLEQHLREYETRATKAPEARSRGASSTAGGGVASKMAAARAAVQRGVSLRARDAGSRTYEETTEKEPSGSKWGASRSTQQLPSASKKAAPRVGMSLPTNIIAQATAAANARKKSPKVGGGGGASGSGVASMAGRFGGVKATTKPAAPARKKAPPVATASKPTAGGSGGLAGFLSKSGTTPPSHGGGGGGGGGGFLGQAVKKSAPTPPAVSTKLKKAQLVMNQADGNSKLSAFLNSKS